MRPLTITMTAFGSYAGTEKVDFGRLGDRALFLIHGPTGAGKTTILDAMCFALFGRTSGAERDGRQMRSDYVEPSVATEVTFDFALGAEVYRVRRAPEQEVLKRRGTGTTKLPPAATLWKRTGLADGEAEGAVVASDWRRVTEALEGLLGFKYEQFRQVVVLPQGEFRRLLLADSAEREKILATLFRTELYRRIEEYFKQAAKGVEEAARELALRREWLLQESAAESAAELTVRLAGDTARLLALTAETAEARRKLQTAQEGLAAARRLEEQFAERERTEAALSGLVAQAAAMEARRAELAGANQAALLAGAYESLAGRRREEERAAADLAAAEAALAGALAAKEGAEAAYAAERQREAERQAAEAAVAELAGMGDKCARLNEAVAVCARTEETAAAAAVGHEAAKAAREAAAGRLGAAREERERLLAEAYKAPALEGAVKEAEQFVANHEQLTAMRGEWQAVSRRHAALADGVAGLEKELAVARDDYGRLEIRWRQGQAALLARELAPGEACPVCGSPHHPAPARGAADMPETAALEAEQARVRRLEDELTGRRRALTEAAQALGEVTARGNKLKELLGERAKESGESLREAADGLAAELERSRAAAADLARREQEILLLEKEAGEREKALRDAETAFMEAQAAVREAKALLAEREKAVPAGFRAPGSLEAAMEQAVARRDKLAASLEKARTAAEEAGRRVAAAKAARAAAGEALAAVGSKLGEEREKLALRFAAAGFAGEEDFLAAGRPDEWRRAAEDDLAGYGRELAVARDRAERAAAAVEGLGRPDVAGAEAFAATSGEVCDNLLSEQTRLQEGVRKQEAWLKELDRLAAETAAMEEEYAVLGRLAQVANGQNQQRVSFHRFVLQALLDEVTGVANARLKKMSRGRYALRRMDDPIHRGKAGGLDIEIEDAWTGVARHAATLSGGETFLASLALALGLADVVQGFSGGVHLDTIFVDEGFGTLDPEALDMAMQALVELQTGGRLVGIISHVPELKERIEARLEIVPTDRGSTTRWSV
ncbi:AAA family ATPase [Anaeroselena agilis]|uniref:Nuclease SbcCD subunit C n=1 Tax=Anaeroselena agilis TaxID=3063788 RepID=A0ABU3NX13_9FIRM|nr:AAA family ATPase [Selenomonadales bacterium 4137-cl]